MKRTRVVMLLLSVLALVAVVHHQLATRAHAAELSNDVGATCNGTGAWNFVQNQTEGATGGTITADFSCGAVATNITTHVSNSNIHWTVATSGSCTLNNATTTTASGDPLPGHLVLSDFTCAAGTPTPTPTPTPGPTP